MVGQDSDKLFLVLRLQEIFHRSWRQLCECLICGSKDRERTLALQSIHKTRGLKCCSQSLEGACGDCGVNDVLRRNFWTRVCPQGQRQYESHRRRKRRNFCTSIQIPVHFSSP